MLELVKLLLGILPEDTTKDTLLTHFIEQARLAACACCNVDELSDVYDGTIAELAAYLYRHRENVGVHTQKQGERSSTYEDGLPQSILAALPLPKVRVVDV
ncbi:MAG: phage head-tail connector protein [Eubacteriales bacterium]|nr:phage head-tail connector protein [Eubacteriales bacterium]